VEMMVEEGARKLVPFAVKKEFGKFVQTMKTGVQ
jgi:hypothetical protein